MAENGLLSPLVDEKPRGSRWHWFRLYMDIDDFTATLNGRLGSINQAHYILHDKDINEDAEPIKSHIHCLLYLYDYKTSSAISKWFADTSGFRSFCVRDPPIAMRYLIHLGFKNKFQYDVEECLHIGSTTKFFNALAEVDKQFDSAVNVIDDIQRGLSTYELVRKYGRDFIYHINSYIKCSQVISSERAAEEYRKQLKKNNEEEYIPPLTLFDGMYDELKKDTEHVPF